MTDQERLESVDRELAEATDGETIERLRARRAVLQERLGYSFAGPPNHRFDPVKHPRMHGQFATAGHPGPEDPVAYAINKRDEHGLSYVYGHPAGTRVVHDGAEHVIERTNMKTTQKSVRLRPVKGGKSVDVDPGTVIRAIR